MVVDVTRCNGCYNCLLACRDEFCGNDLLPYSVAQPHAGQSWIRLVEKERGQFPRVKMAYVAVPCLHCDDPACVKLARDEAVYQREDGVVLIDPAKAVGQDHLLGTCPYGAIFWNEERRVPQKCTLCAHLLDRGEPEPRCVEACPTGALIFGDLDDSDSEVARLVASGQTEVLHPEYGLEGAVRYVGLPKRFVAGVVIFGDTGACGDGAEVTITGEGVRLTTRADRYGDFEFEGLDADWAFTLRVSAEGYRYAEVTAQTHLDVYLGDIVLQSDGTGGR
jgi:Fe-S-cluster-containing dehydrogenase component